MNNIWEAAIKAYKAAWWKTRANKEGQLEYMFVDGVRYAQYWFPVSEELPDTSDCGVSDNVLLKLSVYNKKHKNTYECCIEAYYDSDIEHWHPMLVIDDKNLVLTPIAWRPIDRKITF